MRFYPAIVTSKTLDLDCSMRRYQDDRKYAQGKSLASHLSRISNESLDSSFAGDQYNARHGPHGVVDMIPGVASKAIGVKHRQEVVIWLLVHCRHFVTHSTTPPADVVNRTPKANVESFPNLVELIKSNDGLTGGRRLDGK